MTVHPIRSEAKSRGARMLRTALGPSIAAWLDDAAVIEVMLNPDGRLWVDRLGEGISDTGMTLAAADGERIVRLVAHHVGVEVHARSPRVSAELPEGGERFEGLLPPVVAAPAFAIRKPAVAVFTLDDYAAAGIMSATEAATRPHLVLVLGQVFVHACNLLLLPNHGVAQRLTFFSGCIQLCLQDARLRPALAEVC